MPRASSLLVRGHFLPIAGFPFPAVFSGRVKKFKVAVFAADSI
jgi:hypothetical protein